MPSAWAATKSRSARSLAVRGAMARSTLGRLIPFSARSRSPRSRACATSTTARPGATVTTRAPIRPSSIHTTAPGVNAAMISACETVACTRASRARRGAVTSSKRSPRARRTLPDGVTETTRTLGPARSMRIGHVRPAARAAARTCRMMARQTSGPSCAQLMRAQSPPAASIRATSAGSEAAAAGIVTMMRVSGPSGSAPNRRICSRRIAAWPEWRGCGTLLARGGKSCWPATTPRVARMASSAGSTRDSLCPRDDKPNCDRRRCRSRPSRRRNAR